MAKKLNQWLDEFVSNGADPSNVTNWPENAGGDGVTNTDLIAIIEFCNAGCDPIILTPDNLSAKYGNIDLTLNVVSSRNNKYLVFCYGDIGSNKIQPLYIHLDKDPGRYSLEYINSSSSDSFFVANWNMYGTVQHHTTMDENRTFTIENHTEAPIFVSLDVNQYAPVQ